MIPLCSLTSVYSTLFFKQFQLTSKLWPKVREPYTLSNSSIITLTKVPTGANTITHLLHVFPPKTTFIYGAQIPALAYALILAWTRRTPRFISLGPLGPYWSIAIAIPCTMRPDKFISITISMEAQRLIYGLVFLPVRSPAHKSPPRRPV